MIQWVKNCVAGALIALASVLPASAQNERQEFRYNDFSLGLNDTVDATDAPVNASPDLLNVIIDDPGKVYPRRGFVTCGQVPSGNAATNLYEYASKNGTRRLIVTDNESVWATQDCVTFTRILNGLSSTAKPYFETIRDKLWITNKSTFVYTWDGSTATILDASANTPNPAPPKCQFLEFHIERVWCARTETDPSLVQFTALTDSSGNDLDPSTGTASWPATNALYVDQDSGKPIQGLHRYRDAIYVFKEDSIWRVTCQINCDFDIRVDRTLSAVGTKFQDSIVEHNNLLYFVGPDGIYAFDGNQSVRLSDNFQNFFNGIVQPGENALQQIWNVQSDFDLGTTTDTLTNQIVDSVVLSSTTKKRDTNFNGDFSDTTEWTLTTRTNDVAGVGSCGGATGPTATISGGTLNLKTPRTVVGPNGSCSRTNFSFNVSVKDENGVTLFFESLIPGERTLDVSAYASQKLRLQFLVQTFNGTGFAEAKALSNTGYLFRPINGVIRFTATNSNFGLEADQSWTIDNIRVEQYVDRGTFTANIFNAVTVSTWSVFNTEFTDNGGNLTYQIRFGASQAAVEAASWNTIVPGSIIPAASTDLFIQWRAIFERGAVSVLSPELDFVTLNFKRGDVASNPLTGMSWDNRVWYSGFNKDATVLDFGSKVWTSSTDIAISLLDNADVTSFPGRFVVANSSFEVVADSAIFSSGNTEGPIWTQLPGAMTALGGTIRGGQNGSHNLVTTTNTATVGVWKFRHFYKNASAANTIYQNCSFPKAHRVRFADNNPSPGETSQTSQGSFYYWAVEPQAQTANATHKYSIGISVGNSSTTLSSGTFSAGEYEDDTNHEWVITRDADGLIKAYLNDELKLTGTDTAISSSTRLSVETCGDVGTTQYGEFDNLYWGMASSGAVVSQPFTKTGIREWRKFIASTDNNGGSVTFSIRSSSSPGGLSSVAFSTISLGSDITETAEEDYFQWRALIQNPSDLSDLTFVDDATAEFSFSGSTSDAKNNFALVKSRTDDATWVPYDLQIVAMTKYVDQFYASASTHSAIYVMDQGRNDDGQPIYWYWTSREETFDDPYRMKRLMELHIDYRRGAAANMRFGWKRPGMTDFEWRKFVASGRETRRFFVNGGQDRHFQFRIENVSRDEYAEINSLGGVVIKSRSLR